MNVPNREQLKRSQAKGQAANVSNAKLPLKTKATFLSARMIFQLTGT
jgi:hypothetical protein